jgi:UDP-GlcNAc3NAcA epimerase
MHIMTVIGARPQFIKASALSRRIASSPALVESIIHTGQHYDYSMSGQLFDELQLPAPVGNLDVGSGKHGAQTGTIMAKLESLLSEIRPDLLLVYGDTNSTLAAALVAAKEGVPLAHVEAGLRSFRRNMPEEVNRVVTDRLSDYLFCSSQSSVSQLAAEGIVNGVHVVGDIMLDTFRYAERNNVAKCAVSAHHLTFREYVLATIHRAENTNDMTRLQNIFESLGRVAEDIQVVMPLHPRTRRILNELHIKLPVGIRVIEPCSYFSMVGLTSGAAVIATDSGGLQKEAYFSGVPCVTFRDETEWIETLELGWNRLATPSDSKVMYQAVVNALSFKRNSPPDPIYGNGDTAEKIIDVLAKIS